ncbi:hypothetical protein DRW41_10140 [Neobacillus piezotolerans]|uniref:DUF4825 domain-containing protein n=1 Tax=Neobacillus piezotolerans TaxID=2259171 RepID=A0A3D8GS48_9BACI|nr:hypothetical protein [Neobacillus piezotolerans]RDU37039.1 hypothetical protein DRW41_10140 [Neobacillus piezotolerans]
MKKNLFLLALMLIAGSLLVSCSEPKIVEQEYDRVTLYKITADNKHEKIATLTDKKKIKELTDLINEGNRKNAPEIEFERGPDGMLLFEKNDEKLALGLFIDTGNILTEEFYINSKIDINEYFGTKQ